MPEEVPVADTGDASLNLDAQIGGEQPTGNEGNPAWNDVLGIIPKEFHAQITPHLQEWDRGVQQRFAGLNNTIKSYEGYKQFVDNRIAPADLDAAYKVFQRMNQQPLDFYNRLGELLQQQGLLQAQQQQQAAEDEQQQYQDPRIDQLIQQQRQFAESFQRQQLELQQQQQIQQFAQQVNSQVDGEFSQISQAIGGQVPEPLRVELIKRATFMTEQQQRPVSILEAFQDWQQVQSQVRRVSNAPKVVPSGGGFPQQVPDPNALKSIDGRAAAVKDIIDRYKDS